MKTMNKTEAARRNHLKTPRHIQQRIQEDGIARETEYEWQFV
jgi:hypothetical protein